MTDTVTPSSTRVGGPARPPVRPVRRSPARASRSPGTAAGGPALLRSAAGAAAGAAARGLLPLLVLCWAVWQAEDRTGTDLADVARSAGQLWLVAHGAWLSLPVGALGLTPLGLVLLPLLLARSAGRRVAAAVDAPPLRVAAAVGAPYALLAALLAAACSTADLAASPPGAALLAGLLAGTGAWAGAGGAASLGARVPRGTVPVLRGAAAAVAALLAAGALLTALALVLDAGAARDLAAAPQAGAVGGLGLALLGAVLAPNAVVWGAAWLAGPGFAVGTGTAVTPSTTDLGPLPGLPLAAALPSGPPPSWAVLALAVPVLCGAVGALVLHRCRPVGGGRAAAGAALAVGTLSGLALGLLAAASGGPLGGEHLAAVGPSAWRVGPVVALETATGAALGLALLRRRATSRAG
jgi:hypothetical protein